MGMATAFGVGMDSFPISRDVFTMTPIALPTTRIDSVQEPLMDFQLPANQCQNNKKLTIGSL